VWPRLRVAVTLDGARVLLAAAAAALAAAPSTAKIDVGEWSDGLASTGGSVWVGGLSRGTSFGSTPQPVACSAA
jgi:hypothetical protein